MSVANYRGYRTNSQLTDTRASVSASICSSRCVREVSFVRIESFTFCATLFSSGDADISTTYSLHTFISTIRGFVTVNGENQFQTANTKQGGDGRAMKMGQYPRRPTQSGITVPLFVEQFYNLWNSVPKMWISSPKSGTGAESGSLFRNLWNRVPKMWNSSTQIVEQ